MRINKVLAALCCMPLLYACSSEITPDGAEEAVQPERNVTIKASLPDNNGTRAQVKWGTQNAEDGEIFMWNDEDEIFLFNYSKLKKDYVRALFIATSVDGTNAEFALDVDPYSGNALYFNYEPGDTLIALYGECETRTDTSSVVIDGKDSVIIVPDERRIITIGVGTEANKPQMIVKNPGDADLEYMKNNLKMYDIVTVGEDGKIPQLHFKHLSALMRVTVRNASGKDLKATKIEFDYPGTNSFLNTTLYTSILPDEAGGFKLRPYDTDEFYKGSEVYTDHIGTTINAKIGTQDVGELIYDGESYDLFISTVPRINNDKKGENGLNIHIIHDHHTEIPYSTTIEGFDAVIRPGQRYWFDLTLTPDGKLVRTAELEGQ